MSVILVQSMSLESVGAFEIIFFTMNLFSFFWIGGVKNSMLSQISDQLPERAKAFFSYLVLIGLMSFVFAVIAIIYYQQDSEFPHLYSGILLFFALFFNAPSQLTDVVLYLQKKYQSIVYYSLIVHISQIVIVGVTAYYTGDWLVVLMSFVVWAFAKWLILIIVFAKTIKVHFDWSNYRIYWSSSMYLILFALIGGCMEYVDGVLVEQYFTKADFAIFKYGAREFPLSLLLVTAISASMMPLAAIDIDSAKKNVKIEISKVLRILFVSSSILMFLTPYAYEWVYSQDFVFSSLIFNMYLLILVTRVLVPQVFLYTDSRKRYLIYIGILELIVNISLSIVLIPHMGMIGIVLATMVSYILEKVLSLIVIKKLLDIDISDLIPVRAYVLYSGLLLLCFLVSYYVHQPSFKLFI